MKLLVGILLLISLTACKKEIKTVNPGSYCSSIGKQGYTVENIPYECRYDKNHQLRWFRK